MTGVGEADYTEVPPDIEEDLEGLAQSPWGSLMVEETLQKLDVVSELSSRDALGRQARWHRVLHMGIM